MSQLVWLLVQLAFWVWVLFACVHEWAWLLLAVVAGWRLAPTLNARIAAQQGAERRRRERLVRNADEEHRLVLEGSIDGVYGAYQPPPLIRGMGIWMGRK